MPNSVPAPERIVNNRDQRQDVRSRPLSCIVIIRSVTLLLRLEECVGHLVQMAHTVQFRSRRRRRVRVHEPVTFGPLFVGRGFHFAVLEQSGEQVPLFDPFPVERGF